MARSTVRDTPGVLSLMCIAAEQVCFFPTYYSLKTVLQVKPRHKMLTVNQANVFPLSLLHTQLCNWSAFSEKHGWTYILHLKSFRYSGMQKWFSQCVSQILVVPRGALQVGLERLSGSDPTKGIPIGAAQCAEEPGSFAYKIQIYFCILKSYPRLAWPFADPSPSLPCPSLSYLWPLTSRPLSSFFSFSRSLLWCPWLTPCVLGQMVSHPCQCSVTAWAASSPAFLQNYVYLQSFDVSATMAYYTNHLSLN